MGTRLRYDELPGSCLHDSLHPRGDTQFAASTLDVEIDRPFAEAQDFSDLSGGLPACRPSKRLDLPLTEIHVSRLALDRYDAAQTSGNQCAQNLEIDGLRHVIVGTEPPRRELILPIAQRGQKYERHSRETRRQRRHPLQQLEAGHHGHVDVYQGEVRRILQYRLEAGATVVGQDDLVTAIGEVFGNQSRGLPIILNAKNSFSTSHESAR
jgi:hypothetical protein